MHSESVCHHVDIQKRDILLMMNSVGELSLSSIKERKPSKNTRTKDPLINVICCFLAAR